jgi:hypothetical protein
MQNLTTIKELVVQFNIDKFVKKTIAQINKDLANYTSQNIEKPNTENVLESLIGELLPIIKCMMESNHLEQFIYRVDLNENKWIYFTQDFDFEYLSEQVIMREAQKVYLRELFSTK